MALRFHTVKTGETLSGIASKFGLDWSGLVKLNKLRDPNMIRPGEVIMLPVGESFDDKLRVSRAKAAPAAEAVRAERPSQQPKKTARVDVEVVSPQDAPPAPKRRDPYAGSLAPTATSPYPTAPNPYYDTPGHLLEGKALPGPGAWMDPNYWREFLANSLPIALAGLGPEGSPFRAAAEPPIPYPGAGTKMARQFQAVRQNPSLTQDPNYFEVTEPQLHQPASPRDTIAEKAALRWPRYGRAYRESYEPTQNVVADEGPGLKDFTNAVFAGLKRVYGLPTEGNVGYSNRLRFNPIEQQQQRNREGVPIAEPGSSYAKGTTVSKGSSPFSELRGGAGSDRLAEPVAPGRIYPEDLYRHGDVMHPVRGLDPKPKAGNPYKAPPVPRLDNKFRANQAATVIDFDKSKQRMLEGGWAPRGGAARSGAPVTTLPPRQTQQQKYDAALAKQNNRTPQQQRIENLRATVPEEKIRAGFEQWAADIEKITDAEMRQLEKARWQASWTAWNNGMQE